MSLEKKVVSECIKQNARYSIKADGYYRCLVHRYAKKSCQYYKAVTEYYKNSIITYPTCTYKNKK